MVKIERELWENDYFALVQSGEDEFLLRFPVHQSSISIDSNWITAILPRETVISVCKFVVKLEAAE